MLASLRLALPAVLLCAVACAAGGTDVQTLPAGGAGDPSGNAAGSGTSGQGGAVTGQSGAGESGASAGSAGAAPSAGGAGASAGGAGGLQGGWGGHPGGGGGLGGAAEAGASGAGASGGSGGNGSGGAISPGEYLPIPGGSFPMGRGSGNDACPGGMKCYEGEAPEHTASVSAFALDTHEVTVGRFRKFVESYPGNGPTEGAGSHPKIANSGWLASWNGSLPGTQQALRASLLCDENFAAWTDSPGDGESRPISCVSWYVAFAFCIADGGRLPTEAEWEMAAAGGDENRLYPWGSEAPDATRASFGGVDKTDPHAPVGTHPAGQARWGHHELAGGRWEWVLDAFDSSFYAGAGSSCADCANLEGATRILRGGGWTSSEPSHLRAAQRYLAHPPSARYQYLGFRCAR